MDRVYTYNFLIDTGGEDVHTKFLDSLEEGAEILEDHVLVPGVWHRLKVDVPHSVENVTGKRVALSLAETAKLNIKAYRAGKRTVQKLKNP
jgi:hypothetical protein